MNRVIDSLLECCNKMLHPQEQHKIQRRIEIEPHLLGCETKHILKDKAWKQVRNLCTAEIGFIMSIDEIVNVTTKGMDIDTGNLIYQVEFTVRSFNPKNGDILIARITEIGSDGIFAEIGPMSIYVPMTNIPRHYKYVYQENTEPDYLISNRMPVIKVGTLHKIEMCQIKKLNIEAIQKTTQSTTEPEKSYNYVGGKLMAIGQINDEDEDDEEIVEDDQDLVEPDNNDEVLEDDQES